MDTVHYPWLSSSVIIQSHGGSSETIRSNPGSVIARPMAARNYAILALLLSIALSHSAKAKNSALVSNPMSWQQAGRWQDIVHSVGTRLLCKTGRHKCAEIGYYHAFHWAYHKEGDFSNPIHLFSAIVGECQCVRKNMNGAFMRSRMTEQQTSGCKHFRYSW